MLPSPHLDNSLSLFYFIYSGDINRFCITQSEFGVLCKEKGVVALRHIVDACELLHTALRDSPVFTTPVHNNVASRFNEILKMASLFATLYDSLSFVNVILVSVLLVLLHYLMVLYEFRNMPPGPRLTAFPVLGNVFSLDFKAEKLTDAFRRSVNNTQCEYCRSSTAVTWSEDKNTFFNELILCWFEDQMTGNSNSIDCHCLCRLPLPM